MFQIFKGQNADVLESSHETLDAAIAALARHRALVLPDEYQPDDPLIILDRNVTLVSNGAEISVQLGTDANKFFLEGDSVYKVHSSTSSTQVFGNDADGAMYGNAGRDTYYGEGGEDILIGADGDDNLYGGTGNDILISGEDRDKLYGDEGEDLLVATDGMNRLTGGADADTFVFNTGTDNIIFDFSADEGDQIALMGDDTITDFASLLENANIYQSNTTTIIQYGDTKIQIRDTDVETLSEDMFVFADEDGALLTFEDADSFLATGLDDYVTSVQIGGTVYHLRDEEPVHEAYKFQDDDGNWWSPDYFIIVAAGQSNMVGGHGGGDMTVHPGVAAYDWYNDEIIAADYTMAPANGPGVRTGTGLRNNLYIPMANRVAEETGQPVLVISHAVNGSNIESWLDDPSIEGSGYNYATLDDEIALALDHIEQDSVDAFLWLQGEGNWNTPFDLYEQYFLDLVEQVREEDWSDPEIVFLVGELSRQGDKFWQNKTFQRLEEANTDPYIQFVSSVGLSAYDDSGVHFTGTSLVEYGYERFWDAYQKALAEIADPGSTDTGNTAPTLNPDADALPDITVFEGDVVRIDVSDLFVDAEGDTLYYYSYVDRPSIWLDETEGSELVINPAYDHAGTYEITVYASDYHLDGEEISFTLTVLDRDPGVQSYARRDFLQELEAYVDFETAQDDLKSNRAIEILQQSAISIDGPNLITIDSFHIKGAEGLVGDFALAEGLRGAYFYGEADFNLTGNAVDNYFVGNDGANTISGFDGADRIYGGGGDDLLLGGADNDKLYGDGGADELIGGSGNDSVWGGAGADIFVFADGDTRLDVRDFSLDEGDVIALSGFEEIDDFDDLMADATVRQSDTRVIIDIDDERLVINDLLVEDLSDAMFSFV